MENTSMRVTPLQHVSRSRVALGLWMWRGRRRDRAWVSEAQVKGAAWVVVCLPSLPRDRIPVQ